MATFAQIVLARATQTQGVWALAVAFEGGGRTKTQHGTQATLLQGKIGEFDTAEGAYDGAAVLVETEHSFFKTMNVAIARRLDSEVPDDHPLQGRVDEADDIKPNSEADIERRTEKTIAIWKEVNASRAAETPPKTALEIRGVEAGGYQGRYADLPDLKRFREEQRGVLSTKRTMSKREARKLDKWNKDWHLAWKSEFPPGTNEGDALGNVDTEEGTAMPEVLLIASVTQVGLSLEVEYDQESGEHATVLELLYKVTGVHSDWQRVPANKVDGNTIGPFTAGQVVTLRTDVGNSRDFTELGPEQSVTINAP